MTYANGKCCLQNVWGIVAQSEQVDEVAGEKRPPPLIS